MPEDRANAAPGDPDAWREFCDVMGREDALRRLRTFRATLAAQEAAGIGDETGQLAHRLVGQAGLLGFPALAEAAAALDGCLKAGRDPGDALARWHAEISAATARIDAYLAARAGGSGGS